MKECTDLKENLILYFEAFDEKKDGFIISEHFRFILRKFNDFSDEEIEEMLNECDKNGEGRINYKSFLTYIN